MIVTVTVPRNIEVSHVKVECRAMPDLIIEAYGRLADGCIDWPDDAEVAYRVDSSAVFTLWVGGHKLATYTGEGVPQGLKIGADDMLRFTLNNGFIVDWAPDIDCDSWDFELNWVGDFAACGRSAKQKGI